jgi:hypothetical protein
MTMPPDFDARAILPAATVEDLREPTEIAVEQLLGPGNERTNVVGVAVGVKWTASQPTGQPAILTLVTRKVPSTELRPRDRVPRRVEDVPTDVLAVGQPFAGAAGMLVERRRPAVGGYSVGHKAITAGTISTGVYDVLPGGRVSPPIGGIGVPPRVYILSNNHVLANGNAASIGDAVLQPGPYDGGKDPDDRIATLSRFIPISFFPDIPKENHANVVDAAIAELQESSLDRQLFWVGSVRGWRQRAGVTVGTVVQKVGRSTGYTLGRVTAVMATIDINYGGGRSARFGDQILTTPMSAPGDSGSLLTTLDTVAIGLLSAGSPATTIFNQIENVRSLMMVEVTEAVS